MLSLPTTGAEVDKEACNCFTIVIELISCNLCLFHRDDAFVLIHFHPAYNRALIHPIDKPA
jgi:hypothetical protein